MERFYINIDKLYSSWYRDCYAVEAQTEEEAYKKVEEQLERCKRDPSEIMETDDIHFFESDPLEDTFTELDPFDFGGDPTVELIDDNTNVLWDNVHGRQQ